jgi:hypothetical protein
MNIVLHNFNKDGLNRRNGSSNYVAIFRRCDKQAGNEYLIIPRVFVWSRGLNENFTGGDMNLYWIWVCSRIVSSISNLVPSWPRIGRQWLFWCLWIEIDNSDNANQRSLPEGRNITPNQRSLPEGRNITANHRSLPAVQRELQHRGEVFVALWGLPELYI